MRALLIKLLILSLLIVQHLAQEPAKWCTLSDAEQQKCLDFKQALQANNVPPGITCTKVLHQAQCLRMINMAEMDVISVDDKSIFSGGKKMNFKPSVSEKRTGPDAESFFYKAVIVVRKNDATIQNIKDLQGKKSCHTGVMRTVGWVIPIGNLYKYGEMASQDCENNVKTIAKYFIQSCAPGAYEPYNDPDRENPPNVCGACGSEQCPLSGSSPDMYSGYVGAFRGLVEGKCNAAFVKHSTVPTDAKGQFDYTETDYELLCNSTGSGNSRRAVGQWRDCNWATRPFRAMVVRNSYTHDFVTMMLRARDLFGPGGTKTDQFQLFNSSKYGGRNLMFDDGTKTLEEADHSDYRTFLGEGYLNSYEEFRPKSCAKEFRWCAISDAEMHKCQEMDLAFTARRMTQDLSCVQGKNTDDCFDLIQTDRADVLTVDGGHLYRGGRYFNLRPIAAEVYDASLPGNQASSYYAVAVTMKSNPDIQLNNLRGKKTCHTGFERTAGWNVPVGYFVNKGDIVFNPQTCNVAEGAANYFGNMCTPGALEPEYNPRNDHPTKMCALCPQDCNTGGIYSGYTGAVRCLIEKSGDVAFVKHDTIEGLVNSTNRPSWLQPDMTIDKFGVLCRDGTRKPVTEWQTCNLARVPSHAVVTSNDRSPEKVRHYQYALHRAQIQYRTNEDGSPNDAFFSIFKSSEGSNLLFKDSTKRLDRVMEPSYEAFLGSEYLQTVQALDTRKCYVGAANTMQMSLGVLVLALIISILW